MSRLLEHQLSTAVGLRVSMLGEELPDDMPAGMIFDLVFFGHVGGHLEELEQGRIDIPEWERRTREIEQWMDNDPVVRAFEEEASKAERIPLASRTFLNLAQRQVRRKANPRRANQGIPNSQRPPNFSEGFACAQVLLASVTGRDRWERDLHPDEISQLLAEQWLTGGGLAELLSIRGGSEESTICWDALGRICDALAAGGVPGRKGEFARYKTEVPLPLYAWFFEAAQGLRSRPPEIAPLLSNGAHDQARLPNSRHTH